MIDLDIWSIARRHHADRCIHPTYEQKVAKRDDDRSHPTRYTRQATPFFLVVLGARSVRIPALLVAVHLAVGVHGVAAEGVVPDGPVVRDVLHLRAVGQGLDGELHRHAVGPHLVGGLGEADEVWLHGRLWEGHEHRRHVGHGRDVGAHGGHRGVSRGHRGQRRPGHEVELGRRVVGE